MNSRPTPLSNLQLQQTPNHPENPKIQQILIQTIHAQRKSQSIPKIPPKSQFRQKAPPKMEVTHTTVSDREKGD